MSSKIWIVEFESDSSRFFFSTKPKAKKFIKDCATNDDIPADEVENYFHLYSEKVD